MAILDRHVRQGQRRFTLNEAAVMTGVAIDTVRQAMEALLTTYTCRLQVSEHGDLVYDFGETLHRRGKKTAAERWREMCAAQWKAFTVVYKAWITLFLVVYFGLFFLSVAFFPGRGELGAALGLGSPFIVTTARRVAQPVSFHFSLAHDSGHDCLSARCGGVSVSA